MDLNLNAPKTFSTLLYVCKEAAENELIRLSRVGEHNFNPKAKPNPKLAYRLLLEAATQHFGFVQFLLFSLKE
jgi:hypothetical protein